MAYTKHPPIYKIGMRSKIVLFPISKIRTKLYRLQNQPTFLTPSTSVFTELFLPFDIFFFFFPFSCYLKSNTTCSAGIIKEIKKNKKDATLMQHGVH